MKFQPLDVQMSISFFKGVVDIYHFKNVLWVARKWPKKAIPPYNDVQASYMAVFGVAKHVQVKFSPVVLSAWRSFKSRSLPAWSDQIVSIYMSYFAAYGSLSPVVVDYVIESDGQNKRVVFDVWHSYNYDLTGGDIVKKVTGWVSVDFIKYNGGRVAVSLFNDDGFRLVAPWILLTE